MDPPIPPSDLAAPLRAPPSIAALWLVGTGLLWLLYALVFMGTGETLAVRAAVDAAVNVMPLAVLAVAVRGVLKAEVMRRTWPVQAAWHAGLAMAFTLVWYAGIVLMLAVVSGLEGHGLTVRGFSGPALTWQTFQGLILYAAVAAACYAVRGARQAATVTLVAPQPRPAPLIRYLIRTAEGVAPVEVDDIISVTGAQDYAEVTTLKGRHLVRLSLAEFEGRLDPTSFVRVHRSAIINLRRLTRAEPAGAGRLVAHMTNGDVVQVSRSGAQALRELTI
jgi:two-component system, LytTR family, response regulator